ncbi:hypothetical protein [Tritonibacter mobilis]|uniref:hypothetical protein n=1 Tax=Tritonibacter mobilis TaxID=379347 RepID=UPI001CD9DCD8|nr:hypothetical protein [Tritonibacter mobilis]MCA2007950.1 hypothetical protein [Tritonibacter mobilis]
MRYQVQYQMWSPETGRPKETLSIADRDNLKPEEVAGLPTVGDHIYVMDFKGGPSIEGVVKSRLFTLGKEFTSINIVVEHSEDHGHLIKE